MITLAGLIHHPVWVGWRKERRNGRETKVPYDPRTGKQAELDNPNTWATYDEAANWAAMHGGDGAGLMLGPIDGVLVAGVDLDACRDKATGAIDPWAQVVVDRLNTYWETSPSETGVKLFFALPLAELSAVEALFGDNYGREFLRPNGADHPPAIEYLSRTPLLRRHLGKLRRDRRIAPRQPPRPRVAPPRLRSEIRRQRQEDDSE